MTQHKVLFTTKTSDVNHAKIKKAVHYPQSFRFLRDILIINNHLFFLYLKGINPLVELGQVGQVVQLVLTEVASLQPPLPVVTQG